GCSLPCSASSAFHEPPYAEPHVRWCARAAVIPPPTRFVAHKASRPARWPGVVLCGCLTMTYFRTGNPYYHRRAAVSRSCSGWEGVVPAGYGRQALRGWEGKEGVGVASVRATIMESSRTGH